MKSLFNTIALAALIAVPASLPMVSAQAVASPVSTITVSGSAGLTL